MRTQKEILEKLKEIEETKTDPFRVQFEILVHKLTWANAKDKYVNPKYHDTEHRQRWRKRAKLDLKALEEEIQELIDSMACSYFDKDYQKLLAQFHCTIAFLWLMGPKKDTFLKYIFKSMQNFQEDGGYVLMRMLCYNFDVEWKIMELRYGGLGN